MSRALYGSIVPSYICKNASEVPAKADDKALLLRLDEGKLYYFDADYSSGGTVGAWFVVGEG